MTRYAPLIVFVLLAALLALPLVRGKDPAVFPSPLIGKPAPPAGLPEGAFDKGPALVNFFASWCVSCAGEQQELAAIAKAESVPVYGVDYKDGRQAMERFFAERGNPFAAIGVDVLGRAGIDWGITGVPETFVVDRSGVVRYRCAGPVTEEIYQAEIRPLLAELRK